MSDGIYIGRNAYRFGADPVVDEDGVHKRDTRGQRMYKPAKRKRAQIIDLGDGTKIQVYGLEEGQADFNAEDIEALSGVYRTQAQQAMRERGPSFARIQMPDGRVHEQQFDNSKRPAMRMSADAARQALARAEEARDRREKRQDTKDERAHQLALAERNPGYMAAKAQTELIAEGKPVRQAEGEAATAEIADRRDKVAKDKSRRETVVGALTAGTDLPGVLPAVRARASQYYQQTGDPEQALQLATQQAQREAQNLVAQMRQLIETQGASPETIAQVELLKRQYVELMGHQPEFLTPRPMRPLEAMRRDETTSTALQALLGKAEELAKQDTEVFAWDPTDTDTSALIRQRDDLIGQMSGGYDSAKVLEALNLELEKILNPYKSQNVNAGWIEQALQALRQQGLGGM